MRFETSDAGRARICFTRASISWADRSASFLARTLKLSGFSSSSGVLLLMMPAFVAASNRSHQCDFSGLRSSLVRGFSNSPLRGVLPFFPGFPMLPGGKAGTTGGKGGGSPAQWILLEPKRSSRKQDRKVSEARHHSSLATFLTLRGSRVMGFVKQKRKTKASRVRFQRSFSQSATQSAKKTFILTAGSCDTSGDLAIQKHLHTSEKFTCQVQIHGLHQQTRLRMVLHARVSSRLLLIPVDFW